MVNNKRPKVTANILDDFIVIIQYHNHKSINNMTKSASIILFLYHLHSVCDLSSNNYHGW